jgi:hypothetical protein
MRATVVSIMGRKREEDDVDDDDLRGGGGVTTEPEKSFLPVKVV